MNKIIRCDRSIIPDYPNDKIIEHEPILDLFLPPGQPAAKQSRIHLSQSHRLLDVRHASPGFPNG